MEKNFGRLKVKRFRASAVRTYVNTALAKLKTSSQKYNRRNKLQQEKSIQILLDFDVKRILYSVYTAAISI